MENVQVKKPKKVVDKLKKLHKKHYNSLVKINKQDEAALGFLQAIKEGKENIFGQVSRTESKIYNEKWINIIAETIDSLEMICKNPKKFMKIESYITPIELAKKITSESVIHLSKHSQLVKEIDEKGNVIPNKILTIQAEDNYEIYENRFIKTLLNKLLIFIERRYNYIIKHADTHDSDIMTMQSKIKIGETLYEFDTKVKISVPSEDEGKREANAKLLEKIEILRKRTQFLTQSELILALKDCKPVASPILKTNIIMKNPRYHKCYELWRFFDQYNDLGIGIRIKEAKAKFTDDYFDELYVMMLNSVLTIQTNKTSQIDFNAKGSRKYKIKPKFNFKLYDQKQLNKRFDYETPVVLGGDGQYGNGQYGEGFMTAKQRAAKDKAEKEFLRKEKKRLALLEAKKRAELLAQKRREEAKRRKLEAKRLARLRELERRAQLHEKARLEKEEARRKARIQALIDEELRRLKIARKKIIEKAIQDKEKEAKLALVKKEKAKLLAKKKLEEKKKKELERKQAKMASLQAKLEKKKASEQERKQNKATSKSKGSKKVPEAKAM